jgi:hypothetical protein
MTQTQPDATRHDAPDSFRGIVKSLRRSRTRVWCPTHRLQAVVQCTGIRQLEESAVYDCILECGCTRTVQLAVNRTPSGKEKLTRRKAEKREFKETQELLDAMRSAGTL